MNNTSNTINSPEKTPTSATKPHSIILIHGLYQNRYIMKTLGNRLAKLGYEIHYYDYPTLRNKIADNADAFAQYLTQIETPYTIIGHSLGCLVTYFAVRKLIEAPDSLHPQCILPYSIIAITPPFKGSRIVEYLSENHSGFLVGKSEAILRPSDNIPAWNFPIPLGVIAGTHNSGPSALLLEKWANRLPKDSLTGDGTVYIDETKIAGIQDFITLPKTHTMILFDRDLPQLCHQFITTGFFTVNQ